MIAERLRGFVACSSAPAFVFVPIRLNLGFAPQVQIICSGGQTQFADSRAMYCLTILSSSE
jgi:hypothetical protein